MMTIVRSVATFNTGIVLILGIVHLYCVVRYVRNYNVRDNLTIIVFLYPVSALSNFFELLILCLFLKPRILMPFVDVQVTSSASLLAIYLLKTTEFMFVVALTYVP